MSEEPCECEECRFDRGQEKRHKEVMAALDRIIELLKQAADRE